METRELLRALDVANPSTPVVTSGDFTAKLSNEWKDLEAYRSYRRDVDILVDGHVVMRAATFRHVSVDKLQQMVAPREHRVSIKFGDTYPNWQLFGVGDLNSFSTLLDGIYWAAAAHPALDGA